MVLVDISVKRSPWAKITIDTPSLTGEVEALFLQDAIYDLIIGNVLGAQSPDDPNPGWNKMQLQSIPGKAIT